MPKIIHKPVKTSNSYDVIALMSGTSLDGVDIALLHLTYKNGWKYQIQTATTLPYSEEWLNRLRYNPNLLASELIPLDHEYGVFLAQKIEEFIVDHKLKRENIDLISSHGHTLYHKPHLGYTLQIGNGPEIYTQTGIATICNYRVQDVALKGQGAPLVPIGDKLLFNNYDACINLGGFANISFTKGQQRLAFDICATNYVFNSLAKKLGFEYDDSGELARSGKADENLEKELNKLSYFNLPVPKSLGAEWVEEVIFPILDSYSLSTIDKMASFATHCSTQIANALNKNHIKEVLLTGGGVYNTFVMELIESKTQCSLFIPDKDLIDFKEALIFGLMGVLKIRNEINVLSSVTGASHDHSSGIIYR